MSTMREPTRWTEGLHLATLCSLAIGWPLFEVLGQDAEFFVARRSQPVDLWLAALAPTVALPVALTILLGLIGLMLPRVRRGLLLVLVGALLVLLLAPPLNRLDTAWPIPLASLISVAVLFGVFGTVLYARWPPARTFLTVLSPAPLVVASLFLFGSPVSHILEQGDEIPAAQIEVANPIPVVFVILDELPITSLMDPDGGIDATLFPNFARLAADSTWYRNFTANHASTNFALPILLTGRHPPPDRNLPVAADHPENLFTLLGGSYRLAVWETQTALCPAPLVDQGPFGGESLPVRLELLLEDASVVFRHLVLPEPWRSRLPSVDQTWGRFRIDEDLERQRREIEFMADRAGVFREFIAAIDGEVRPNLYFLHVVLPHVPWTYVPSGRQYFQHEYDLAAGLTGLRRWSAHEGVTQLALQRHLLQLGLLDRLIGELLDRLAAVDLYDHCLLVVAADHGASFIPGTLRRQVDDENLRDILHVPLFVRLPGQPGPATDDSNVEAIDLVPTIAAAVGAELPWPTDGQSALDAGRTTRPVKIIHHGKDRQTVVEDVTLPSRWPSADRKQEIFGEHPSWEDVIGLTRRPELVGRSVGEVPVLGNRGLAAQLANEHQLENVDVSSDKLPLYVSGDIDARRANTSPQEVAIAVNGIIRTVVKTHDRSRERASFAAMVSEDAFHDGANEVVVLAVLADGRLASMEARDYRLEAVADGGSQFLGSDGVRHPVVADAVSGVVQSASIDEGVLVLTGWAADLENGVPADEVLFVVDGGQTVFVSSTGARQRDFEEEHGRHHALATAGFRFRLPLDLVGGQVPPLRVFGLAGEVASELRQSLSVQRLTHPRFVWHGDIEDGVLFDEDGRRMEPVSDRFVGALETAEYGKAALRLAGWASDPATRRPCDFVVVTVDEHVVGWLQPRLRQTVVGPEGAPAQVDSGFEYWLPVSLLERSPEARVRVHAVSNGKSQRLEPGREALWLER